MFEPNVQLTLPRTARQRLLDDALPFLASLSVHASVVIVAVLTYHAIRTVAQPSPPEVQTFVPDSPMLHADPAGAWKTFGNPVFKPTTAAERPGQTKPFAMGAGHGFGAEPPSIATVGPDSPASGFRIGVVRGSVGEGPGVGDALSAFGDVGAANGTGGSLGNSIFVRGPGAHKIAFLCDASGSMLPKLASLKDQLAKAIDALHPTQSFNVIFFQDQSCKSFSQQLAGANPHNKQLAMQFLADIIAAGSTDPLPSLQLAFQEQPEVIYLLTDGDFPDNTAVLRKIRTLEAARHVQINTIAFVTDGDTDTDFIDLLKTIATETGGTYKHVIEQAL